MNCPKCGKELAGIRCENCEFDFKISQLQCVIKLKDEKLTKITQYIYAKGEEQKENAEKVVQCGGTKQDGPGTTISREEAWILAGEKANRRAEEEETARKANAEKEKRKVAQEEAKQQVVEEAKARKRETQVRKIKETAKWAAIGIAGVFLVGFVIRDFFINGGEKVNRIPGTADSSVDTSIEVNTNRPIKNYGDYVCTSNATFYLNDDGTVTTVNNLENNQCDTSDWKDIVRISANDYRVIGLKSDGTVVDSVYDGTKTPEIVDWENVSEVYAEGYAITNDGKVLSANMDSKYYASEEAEISAWSDIIEFASTGIKSFYPIGLKSDGTVELGGWDASLSDLAEDSDFTDCGEVLNWTDVVSIAATDFKVVGVKSDGSVLCACEYVYNNIDDLNPDDAPDGISPKDILALTDVKKVVAGLDHFVFIKNDGSIVALGNNVQGQCEVSRWKDIVDISASGNTTLGYKADGTIVRAGYDYVVEKEAKEISGWGDSDGGRPRYTTVDIKNGVLGDRIMLNNWKENFVAARINSGINMGTDNIWNGNTIKAENGEEYFIRLIVENANPNGEGAVSENTRVAFNIPTESGTLIPIHGYIFSDNAEPTEYWDGVCFNNETPFHLEYIYGSALMENNGIGKNGGIQLGDEIVTRAASENGIQIGYTALDGRLPGGTEYTTYVTIRVRAVFDS